MLLKIVDPLKVETVTCRSAHFDYAFTYLMHCDQTNTEHFANKVKMLNYFSNRPCMPSDYEKAAK